MSLSTYIHANIKYFQSVAFCTGKGADGQNYFSEKSHSQEKTPPAKSLSILEAPFNWNSDSPYKADQPLHGMELEKKTKTKKFRFGIKY